MTTQVKAIDNPIYWRSGQISVAVQNNWLTCDGDYEDTTGAWEEIQNEIKKALSGIYQRYGHPDSDIHVNFEGWDGEPEIESNEKVDSCENLPI